MKRTLISLFLAFALTAMLVPAGSSSVAAQGGSITTTVTIASGSPVPIINYKKNDMVSIVATLSTDDVNENGEGEPLILKTSTGDLNSTLAAYAQTVTFSFTASAAGTLSGFIEGFDDDESASVTVTLNPSGVKLGFLTQADRDILSRTARYLNATAGITAAVAYLCGASVVTGPVCGLEAAGISALSWAFGEALNTLAIDPTDPNFMVIAQPVFPSLPLAQANSNLSQAEADALNAVTKNEEQILGYARVLITTINRAQGAADAGNTFWKDKQLQAATQYRNSLGAVLDGEPMLRTRVVDLLLVDPKYKSMSISADQVLASERDIADNGLPAPMVQTLTQLGADSTVIENIRKVAMVQDIDAVAGNFPTKLADLGLINAIQQTAQSLGATPTTNFIDTSSLFVRQQYLDFLNREPEPEGFAYWTNQITGCGTTGQCIHDRRVAVADAFFFEPEFQQTGGYIYQVYRTGLGQYPTFAQFMTDRSFIAIGAGLNQSKTDYALDFVQRNAFLQLYPRTQNAAQFVTALLNSIKLHSGVDLSSQSSSLQSLYNGTDQGRAGIIKQVADNPSVINAEYNQLFVLMEYFGYLRRDPEPAGFNFWLAKVNGFPSRNIGIQQAMACSFITSAEYQLRFGPVVTHSNRECPQ